MRPFLFAAAVIGAASVLTTAEAVAQCSSKSIPLPEPTLLTPTPEFSCVSKTASASQPQSAAGPSQADPGAEAAAFDYERQCNRQVRAILRDRLLQLQGSVNEMVKAVNRACPAPASTARSGPKASIIPLPRRALLTPPPDVDCTFKHSPDGGTPTPAQAAAAQRMKVDYERQCYRQSEMILRNGMVLLQDAVWETIKALNRDAAAAAKRRPVAAQQPVAMEPAAMEQPAAVAQQPNGRTSSRAKEAPCAGFSNGNCIGRDPDPRVRLMMSHDRGD